MREIALIEWTGPGDVAVLARSDNPELVERVTAELAADARRRLAKMEGLALVPDPDET